MKCTNKMFNHRERVGVLDWFTSSVLTSGSKDGHIINNDLRIHDKINELVYHHGEVCGLKWCKNKRYLASGSDDHQLLIWDLFHSKINPLHSLNAHKAAVKAIDWCPWMNNTNLLATGGGKKDGTIRIWNIYDGANVKILSTNNQVSGVLWCNNSKYLLASHEENFSVLKYPSLNKCGTLDGHDNRILSIAKSNVDLVASLGADERLRIWECFRKDKNPDYYTYNLTPISTRNLGKFNIR
jgi:WD40 repeat protein